MKKIISIALVLVLALSLLTACGGKDNNSTPSNNGGGSTTTPPTSQGENNTQNNSGNTTADLTTVDGWFAYWGLTESDLKPANFTRFDKTSYASQTGEIHEVGAFINKKLTDDEARVWIEKVLTKLGSMATEGKLANILKDGETLTADYIMSQDMWMGSGDFTYKGKKVNALITVTPGYLDSDDPDDAMAACTLKLSY
jgi:hypothetical protein